MIKTSTIFITGLLILFVGIIYNVIFAGIPYQDPPLYLQERYAFHTQVSNVIMSTGFFVAVVAAPLYKLFFSSKKKKSK